MVLYLEDKVRDALAGEDSFDHILRLDGQVYRQLENRRTLCIELGGQRYFIKAHFGVGWKEIFKNLLVFRWPVLGARTEVRAIQRLKSLGVDTLEIVGYGWRGVNPASQESFVMTKHLGQTITLEDFCRPWRSLPPDPRLKRRLIARVAQIAHVLHHNGVNHRDFYLCHFHVSAGEPQGAMWLIDLHRAQLRDRTPRRWAIKDLGGLYFSAMDIGLTKRDLLRFISWYARRSLRESLIVDQKFWQEVSKRATSLYRAAPTIE